MACESRNKKIDEKLHSKKISGLCQRVKTAFSKNTLPNNNKNITDAIKKRTHCSKKLVKCKKLLDSEELLKTCY